METSIPAMSVPLIFQIEKGQKSSMSPLNPQLESLLLILPLTPLSFMSSDPPRQYPCLYHGCEHISIRSFDLQRHMKKHIPIPAEDKFDCPGRGCGRVGINGFDRKDPMTEHLRNYHRQELSKGRMGGGRNRDDKSGTIHMKTKGSAALVKKAAINNRSKNIQKRSRSLHASRERINDPDKFEMSMSRDGERTESKSSSREGFMILEKGSRKASVNLPASKVDIDRTLEAPDGQPQSKNRDRNTSSPITNLLHSSDFIDDKSKQSAESSTDKLLIKLEVMALLIEHEALKPLYKSAIKDEVIPPEQFSKSLDLFLKCYSIGLEDEAPELPHKAAARLISSYCTFVSDRLMSRYKSNHNGRQGSKAPASLSSKSSTSREQRLEDLLAKLRAKHSNGLSPPRLDQDLGQYHDLTSLTFSNLDQIKAFMVSGSSFKELQKNIEDLIQIYSDASTDREAKGASSKVAYPITDSETMNDYSLADTRAINSYAGVNASTMNKYSVADLATMTDFPSTDCDSVTEYSLEVIMTLTEIVKHSYLECRIYARRIRSRVSSTWRRYWEPALEANHTRIRWTCQCGSLLWDDFRELRPGAAEELRRGLEVWKAMDPAGPTHLANEGNRADSLSSESSSRSFEGSSSDPDIPSTSSSMTTISTGSVPNMASANRTAGLSQPSGDTSFCSRKFLLLCFGKLNDTLRLSQLNIEHVTDDFSLFTMLRSEYASRRNIWALSFSPWKVVSINFRKVKRALCKW